MTDCLRLTAYLGERQRVNSHFAADEILDLFSRRRVANSVLLRGIAGFGAHHILRTDESLTLSEDPPVVIAAVDVADVIAPLADDVAATIPQGLVTVESARLLDAPAVDSALPADAMVSMSIALGRNRHVNGVPVFVAVCDLLYRNHFAGATALLGVDGTSHGERRRARFFGRNLDVPLAIVAVGTVAQMNSVFPALQTILDRPLLSVERVQLCKRNGVLLAEPGAEPRDLADRRSRLAEAHRAHFRSHPPRWRAHPPGTGSAAAGIARRQRGDRAPRNPRFSRRSSPARRRTDPVRPAGSGDDGGGRHPGQHHAQLRNRRRTHRRPWTRDLPDRRRGCDTSARADRWLNSTWSYTRASPIDQLSASTVSRTTASSSACRLCRSCGITR